jgi:hypothetical protein
MNNVDPSHALRFPMPGPSATVVPRQALEKTHLFAEGECARPCQHDPRSALGSSSGAPTKKNVRGRPPRAS